MFSSYVEFLADLLRFWEDAMTESLVFVGAKVITLTFFLTLSGLVVSYAIDRRKDRNAALQQAGKSFTDKVLRPLLTSVIVSIIGGFLVGPFLVYRKAEDKAMILENGNQPQVAQIGRLQRALLDRMKIVHVHDPAYQRLAALVVSFEHIKQRGIRPCSVFIVDPMGPSSVYDALALASGMAVCEQGFNATELTNDSEGIAAGLQGYLDDHVVIHAAKGNKDAQQLEDDWGPLFLVRQDRTLLKSQPDRFLWVQVGKNVKWNEGR